jgi:DNA-binding Xre family transcriptional regulator
MAKKWETLRSKDPDRRARIDARVAAALKEMPLHELRRARDLTQQQLAEAMGMNQGNISKLERRTDMYVSTLRTVVEAMGGTLEIIASFPDGDVRIQQFRTA